MLRLAACVSLIATAPVLAAPRPKDAVVLPPITPEMLDRSANNFKQLGIALHNYDDTYGSLPVDTKMADGSPGLSWRVALLPFIEEYKLFKEFKFDEAWSSPANLKAAQKLPAIYAPQRGRAKAGETFVQMASGKFGMLGEPLVFAKGNMNGVPVAGVPDGTLNTIMAFEAETPVLWSKPGDTPFDGKATPKLGGCFDGDFHAVMCDGHVFKVPRQLDVEVIRKALGRRDGEDVDLPQAIKNVGKAK